jgi:pyruvate formate lyase activating enzyme
MSKGKDMTGSPFFRPSEEGKWLCLLCPHGCVLSKGQSGLCRVRRADSDGIRGPERPVTVVAADPVEKKPFYHFLPGSMTLSLGFAGCNLRCPFCQNHELVDSRSYRRDLSHERIVRLALEEGLPSVSFTYSEPLVHIEFLIELSTGLHKEGIRTLLITNGCINPGPGALLLEHLDGVKVDLKSFNPLWYKQELGGDLDAVKGFIRLAAASPAHLEVVTLVVPGRNDSPEEIGKSAAFLAGLDRGIPYHLSGYFPRHRYSLPPTEAESLLALKDKASESLDFVYTGNLGLPQDSLCPDCGATLITRDYPAVRSLISENSCPRCGRRIPGFFAGC